MTSFDANAKIQVLNIRLGRDALWRGVAVVRFWGHFEDPEVHGLFRILRLLQAEFFFFGPQVRF